MVVEGGATAAAAREVGRVRDREVGRVGGREAARVAATTVDSVVEEVEELEKVEGVEELEMEGREGREGREEEQVREEERDTSVAEAGWGRLGGIPPWRGWGGGAWRAASQAVLLALSLALAAGPRCLGCRRPSSR